MWIKLAALSAFIALSALMTHGAAADNKSFTAFETGQVRPLAISPDGSRLFAANTPDGRLEIFDITPTGLTPLASVPVGMEPVAVAARSRDEVWVVNQLSDSVSIVRKAGSGFAVAQTLSVGDEPSDIVFAGAHRNLVFVTAARRNLNATAGTRLGKADVYVFNADNPGAALGGNPLTVINLFCDTPRALAVSADGLTVYAAAFHSGNRTTTIDRRLTGNQVPPPGANAEGVPAPATGYVVQFDGTKWRDGIGQDWTSRLGGFSLPDLDVFKIDAGAAAPRVTGRFSGVGTILFNMVVNPVSGRLYVTNTEARNVVRFEGHGSLGGSTVRGHIAENRITVLDGSRVLPRHLNKHIDYESFRNAAAENAKSLASPLGMAITDDGSTLYVAAFGSSKIGVLRTAELEADTFEPSAGNQITVSGGGPSGLVLDEARNRLYVLTRFDNAISTIELASRREVAHVAMYNPEPPSLTKGRPFLYDARYTSSRGDSSCASCHVFGDVDSLAWDLGDPDAPVTANPNPIEPVLSNVSPDFHPMKGPMLTQSLRGLATHGPMHWRGDRTGARVDENSAVSGDAMDERAAFMAFNVAFEGLLGRAQPLTQAEMAAFTDFALQLAYPPNPIRSIDDKLTEAQARGRDFYFTHLHPDLGNVSCNDCHQLDPAKGFFGTDGVSVMLPAALQAMKTPHLRSLYARVATPDAVSRKVGPQLRGFGFSHDGNSVSLLRFFSGRAFDFPKGDPQRLDVIAFLMAFDSDLAPAVGQQVTLAPGPAQRLALARVALLAEQAGSGTEPACELIVKGTYNGESRGWLRLASGGFRSDRNSEPVYPLKRLIEIATGSATVPASPLTFTCVPPGSGTRMGLDRDEDGIFDRDEVDAGRSPTNPAG